MFESDSATGHAAAINGRRSSAPETLYNASELALTLRPVGGGYRLHAPGLSRRTPVLAGHFDYRQLRPGLSLHVADAHDLHTLSSEMEQQAGLGLVLVLAGDVDASVGPQALKLSGRAGPVATMTSLTEPERFVRRALRGRHARKVSVGIEPSWLDGSGVAGTAGGDALAILREHLTVKAWQPSARAIALAEQLVHPPAYESLLQNLYLESRALDLVVEAFNGLARTSTRPAPSTSLRDLRRLQDFIGWLDSGEADGLSLDELARRACVNPTTLQQRFRQARGCSVFEYLRRRRLAAARSALECQGLSVAQAAELAGYTSAANFATAFKGQFGLSPRDCRARC
ncbi:MAG: helix-turn-helix domain-containing protein [Pseudomonadota bacterium]